MSTVPLVCGTYRLSQIAQYQQTDLIQCCLIKQSRRLLIDIALSDDSNINTEENVELNNYKDPDFEKSRMWKMRTNTAPVIIGALGSITKIKPSVAPRSPGGYRATEGHTNEHCTQHW